MDPYEFYRFPWIPMDTLAALVLLLVLLALVVVGRGVAKAKLFMSKLFFRTFFLRGGGRAF